MRRLRPHSHLFREGFISVVAFSTPVFLVLYWLTAANGRWLVVFVLQVIATALVTLATLGYFGVAIWVSPDAVAERGFFGRKTTFARSQIGSIVIAETQSPSSREPTAQLFICDPTGRLLVRMRGQFWSRENMDLVRSTLDVPATRVPEAVTTGQLRQDFPDLLYWFERHPLVAGVVFAGVVVVAAGLSMGFLYIAGLQGTA
jgi:hypothetical protein